MKITSAFLLVFFITPLLWGQQRCFSDAENPIYTKHQICFYDSSCTKIKEVYFLVDEINNVWKNIKWYENGHISFSVLFYKGIPIDAWTNWYPNGIKQKEGRCNYDSSYVSLPVKYSADTLFIGDSTPIILTFAYKNPRVGDYKEWYVNGSIWIEGKFKDYKCTNEKSDEIKIGVWKYYFDDGTLAMEKYYDNNGKLLQTKIIK